MEENNPIILKAELSVSGDVNMDGVYNIADVVCMQRYIFGGSSLNNWKAGDLYADGLLDVFDLCLMKQKLLES